MLRNAYNWFFTKPATETLTERPKSDTLSGMDFAPIKEVEKDLNKKLEELRCIQDELLQYLNKIPKEEVEDEKAISEEISAEAKKAPLEAKSVASTNPTEKLIEFYIFQAKLQIESQEHRLKAELKSHADYRGNCLASLQIQRALYLLIFEIRGVLVREMKKLTDLPEKIENSLDMAATVTGHKAPILEILLNIVKLSNILFKKPVETAEVDLFIQIESGLNHAILFLNNKFFELHALLEQFKTRYPSEVVNAEKKKSDGSGALLSEVSVFKPKVETRDVATQTESFTPS